MNQRRIDQLASRAGTRISQKMLARLGSGDIYCADLEADMQRTIQSAQSIACAADDTRRLLRNLPQYQKDAINALYKSIAESSTKATMAKVRNALIGHTADVVHLTPAERRQQIKRELQRVGLKKDADGVIQTAIRTHGAVAYNAAIWVANQKNPRVWGYEYITAEDERVRPQHSEMHGIRYPKLHLFWRRYAPPNGYNCRCRLEPIFFGDSKARIRPFRGTPDIDFNFRFNPGMIFQAT